MCVYMYLGTGNCLDLSAGPLLADICRHVCTGYTRLSIRRFSLLGLDWTRLHGDIIWSSENQRSMDGQMQLRQTLAGHTQCTYIGR